MKNVAVLTEDGAFALFFRPHPGGFDSSRVPTPGNLPSKAKKMLMPGVQPGGGPGRRWNWLMHSAQVRDPSLALRDFMRLNGQLPFGTPASPASKVTKNRLRLSEAILDISSLRASSDLYGERSEPHENARASGVPLATLFACCSSVTPRNSLQPARKPSIWASVIRLPSCATRAFIFHDIFQILS